MRHKASLLIALLFIVLMSLSVACANENTAQTLADDNDITVVCEDENTAQTLAENNDASEDVDLEVSITRNYVEDTVDFSWTVTVTNYNGISKNVIVQNNLPDIVKIVAFSQDCGIFDLATNDWIIGDLAANDTKSIQFYGIFNNRLGDYNFPFTVESLATTDSHDTYSRNNWDSFSFPRVLPGPVSSQSGFRISFNLGSYLPTYKYNSYRAPPKKVKVPAKKTTTKKKAKKKTKKKKLKRKR